MPTDPEAPGAIHGVAIAAAAQIERWLRDDKPTVMAIGTGRTLKAAIEQLSPMEAPQHKIVSLTGSIAPDGSAAFYNVIFNIAETVKARSFPDAFAGHRLISGRARHAVEPADDQGNPRFGAAGQRHLCRHRRPRDRGAAVVDGFISPAELKLLQKAGAVGEIVGWAFDAEGKFISGLTNDRVASAPLPSRESSTVVATAVRREKVPGIRAALTRRLVNGLITDEQTAEAILAAD